MPPTPETQMHPVDLAHRQAHAAVRKAELIRDHYAEIAEVKRQRKDLDAILQRVKVSPTSICRSDENMNAAHYITNAVMWLGMELKRLGEADPYPESRNPNSTAIAPTADGLKL